MVNFTLMTLNQRIWDYYINLSNLPDKNEYILEFEWCIPPENKTWESKERRHVTSVFSIEPEVMLGIQGSEVSQYNNTGCCAEPVHEDILQAAVSGVYTNH